MRLQCKPPYSSRIAVEKGMRDTDAVEELLPEGEGEASERAGLEA